ncbi:MAG TPA: tripartite tricarboxylate transporter substrate binding protein, partial [Acetobacteraceae bacterium]|nr:tripartite tricarboxylate transporter substrate binding protein [Acetobacteraceae bacterium]
MPVWDRRSLVAGAAVAMAGSRARAQDRSIRMLVGFAAGGLTDVTARMLATGLQEGLGQPVVV